MPFTGLRGSSVTGVVSVKHVVYSEILAVTSIMRKNSRWATSNQTYNARESALASNLGLRRTSPAGGSVRRGTEEDELMSAFEELKRELRSTQGASASIFTSVQ
jgi:golgi-specific brefeldin A-resistance guanine nucleotide exchange factor 1